jgi:predicted nucleotidyltransferase
VQESGQLHWGAPRYPQVMRFSEVLTTFAEFLDREQIPWAIAGGLAVAAWGYQRATHDIDFVIAGADRERVTAFAESLGYETTYASEGFSNHIHPSEDFGHVDLLYVYGPTATEMFAAATKRVIVGTVTAPVISAEHLAMMKAAAIKDHPERSFGDARDVEYLLTLADIDREAIRDYFERLDLLKIFNAIDHENNG